MGRRKVWVEEDGEKERENLYFFKNFQRGGGEFEILWGNVFLGLWGDFWVEEEKG